MVRIVSPLHLGILLDIYLRNYEKSYQPIILAETWMDFQAEMVKLKAWMRGLMFVGGFSGAHKAAAGLA